MKTILSVVLLLATGSALAATEKKAEAPKPLAPAQAAAAVDPKAAVAAAVDSPLDSPLVQAAKRSKRTRKTSIVITDETLRTSKGHITTSTINPKLNVPEPIPSVEQTLMEQSRKEKAAAADRAATEKKVADEKQQKLNRRAAAAEEDDAYDQEDPAQAEGELERMRTEKEPKKP